MASGTLFTVVVGVTFLNAVGGFALAAVAWHHRETQEAVPFGALSVVAGVWSLLHALFLLSETALVAYSVGLASAAVAANITPAWLVFCIVYTGHGDWLSRSRLAALWTPPVAYALIEATAPFHDLATTSVRFLTVDGVTAPYVPTDPAVRFALGFSYVYLVAAYVLLGRFFVQSRNVYRAQTAAVIVGSTFPVVGNALTQLGTPVHPGVDLTPAFYLLNIVVVALALFRYDLLNLSPVIGDVLVDSLPEPVIVADDGGRVIDHNPAAAELTGGSDPAGRHVDDLVPGLSDHVDPDETVTVEGGSEGHRDGLTVFDPQSREIEDQHGTRHGRLIVLRDVTAQQRRLDQLESLQSATQQLLAARTDGEVADIGVRIATDVLDTPLAALFTYDEATETLRSQAINDQLDSFVGWEDLDLHRDDSAVWQSFDSGELTAVHRDEDFIEAGETLPVSGLLMPLGDHGIMGVGDPSERDYSEADRQFARILAGTVETALTRVEHERELRRSKTALEQRKNHIEFFNGVLRHNIRNGMLVIDGHAHHLQETAGDGREELSVIREWCDELTELTEKVRAINDTVTASQSRRLEAVDLTRVVEQRADAVADDYAGRLDLDVDDGVVVEANALVEDVVESLLRNAFEHNDAADPEVTVTTQRAGEWVQVRIGDNGPGISDEMKEQVFEKAMTTSETAAGFGLYFVSVMMDLYGGDVWFEDNDPRGTVATLEFSLAEDAPVLEA